MYQGVCEKPGCPVLDVEDAADRVLALVVAQLEKRRSVQRHPIFHQGPVRQPAHTSHYRQITKMDKHTKSAFQKIRHSALADSKV